MPIVKGVDIFPVEAMFLNEINNNIINYGSLFLGGYQDDIWKLRVLPTLKYLYTIGKSRNQGRFSILFNEINSKYTGALDTMLCRKMETSTRWNS